MAYGDKRDYRKIDLYVAGRYVASTTWSLTLYEAMDHYAEKNKIDVETMTARHAPWKI